VNLKQPGTRLSKQNNYSQRGMSFRSICEIAVYFNAVVEPIEQLDASGTRATSFIASCPARQARVESFNINITGFDPRH